MFLKRKKNILIFLFFLLQIPLRIVPAHGYLMTPPTRSAQETLLALLKTNQLVVRGFVKKGIGYYDTEPASPLNTPIIFTDYQIRVEKVLKGSLTDQTVTIRVLGGCVEKDEICMTSDIAPKFKEDEEVILFLNPTPDGKWSMWDPIYGKETYLEGFYQPLDMSLDEIMQTLQNK